MLNVFLYSLITNFIYYCLGYSIFRYSSNLKSTDKIIFNIIFGAIFLSFIALFLNFFFSLNKELNSIIYLLIIVIFFIKRKNFKLEKKLLSILLLISLFTGCLILYSNIYRPDAGLYHLPFVGIINNEKIIFGLTNIHFRFGAISIIQYLSAINNNLLFKEFGILIPLASLSISFIIYFHYEVIKFYRSKQSLDFNNFFCLLVIVFIFYKINRYSGFGNDALAHLSFFYLISFFLKMNLEKFEQNKFNIFYLITIFTFLNKNTMILAFLFPLIFFFFHTNKFIILKKNIFSFSTLFLILWLIKNFLNSGCFIYPLNLTCFDNLVWSNYLLTQEVAILGEAWAKGWINSDLKIEHAEFNKKFIWLNSWFEVHGKIFGERILLFCFLVLFFISFSFQKKKEEFLIKKNFIIIFFITLICSFIFLIKFPLFRYGYSFLISFIILIFFLITKNYINTQKFKYVAKVIIFLSIFIILTKQFIRVHDKIFYSNSKDIWPNIYELNDSPPNYKKIYLTEKNYYYFADSECMYSNAPCTNIFHDNLKTDDLWTYKVYYNN